MKSNIERYINNYKKLNTIVKVALIGVCILIIVCIIIYFYRNTKNKQNTIELFEENIEAQKHDTITSEKLLSTVVLIGTARNIESHLPKTFENIKMICDCFEKSNVIIYENDSTDKTLEMLQNFAKETPNVEIITEKNIPGLRTHRLAYARTITMNKARELHPEYIVLMDLDDVNNMLTKEAFMTSFNYPELDWAVMTANQSGKYYDLWALRTYDDWMPFDPWECNRNKNDTHSCVNKRFKNIPREKDPILVKSAFGGLGIYKTKYLDGCKYDGGKDSLELCEHVSFNEGITNKGGKIYINPKMINSIGNTS